LPKFHLTVPIRHESRRQLFWFSILVLNSWSSFLQVIAANFLFGTVVTSLMSEIRTVELRVGYLSLGRALITSNVSLLTRLATFSTSGMTAPRRAGTSVSHWVHTLWCVWRFPNFSVQACYCCDHRQFRILLNEFTRSFDRPIKNCWSEWQWVGPYSPRTSTVLQS
jgi:hypothetical protein